MIVMDPQAARISADVATDRPTQSADDARAEFAAELRRDVVAVRLDCRHVSRSKTFTSDQKSDVANLFAADRGSVTGSKKLFPPNQPQIKAISSAVCSARKLWERHTIATTTRGVRLMRKDQLGQFEREFNAVHSQLLAALKDADYHYAEIMQESRNWLKGKLFNSADYPDRFADSVSIGWSVHNFEPPEELLKLSPQTYRREQARVRAEFNAAIAIFEQETKEQMADLVDVLLSKVDPKEGEAPKRYAEGPANNLRDFFDRFESLSITSDSELTSLVSEAKAALGGTRMKDVKNNAFRRRDLADSFKDIKSRLDTMTENAPARSIDVDDLD